MLEDPSDGRCTEMQAGAAQYLGDRDLAQRRAQSLESLHGVSNEIWKPVDRLAVLYERIGSLLGGGTAQ